MFGQNVGAADRFVRLLIGLVLFGLAVVGMTSGVLLVIVYALSAVMFLTAAIGYCPLYSLVGIDTRRTTTGGSHV